MPNMYPYLEMRLNGGEWEPIEFDPFSSLHSLLYFYHTLILADDNNLVEYRSSRLPRVGD